MDMVVNWAANPALRMKSTGRIIWPALTALFAIPLLLAPSASAQDRLRVGLATSDFPAYAAFYTAQAKDIFKANGLKVETTVFQGGGAAQQALAAGAVDIIAGSPPSIAAAVLKGVQQRCIGGIGASPRGWYLLVDKDSRIGNARELGGAKIGVSSAGGTPDNYAKWVGSKSGTTFQRVPLGNPNAMVTALKSKQVDGIVIYPPSSFVLQSEGSTRTIVDFGKELPPHPPGCWATSVDLINQKPDLLLRFMKSIAAGVRDLKADRTKTIEALGKLINESDPKIRTLIYDSIITDMSEDSRIDDQMFKASLELAGVSYSGPLTQFYDSRFMVK